ncbi:TPA: hypothetical protein R1X65_001678, partial [Campylobacter upsaliensis]|nr:hypothetical protein [Campylobacter upsaliensis]HEC1582693.1 hypothetical protein [Campylobacter upsaliensis]
FIPNLPRELKEALGKEIKLTKGSLYKIVEKGREKYIPQMKQTLQNPDFALRDRDNMLILAKQIEDKQYFTSVNLETKDYFISVSNAPKKENILKNKVENGAEILYQSPNAKSIFYTDTLLQTDKSSANKIDEDIIAQNEANLKAEFEKAKSEAEKIEIVKRELLKQNEALQKEVEGLSKIIKENDYTQNEYLEIEPLVKEARKNGNSFIRANIAGEFIGVVNDPLLSLKNQVEKILARIKRTEIEKITNKIRQNNKKIRLLEWDLKHALNHQNERVREAHKVRLDKNLDKLSKSLLKDEREYLRSLSLNYDLSTQEGLKKTRELFYKSFKPSEEQKALFESVLPVARQLGVYVRGALRDPYEMLEWGETIKVAGWYVPRDNSARVKHSLKKEAKGKTLLHELIHSVTTRAMYAYEKGDLELLSKRQIRAIENINELYRQITKQSEELGFKNEYGLKNPHEMIAELSNVEFVEKLKKVNVFEKLIDNILKLFVSAKEMLGLKRSNAYEKLKENLSEIMQNYKPNFSEEYEKKNYRKFILEGEAKAEIFTQRKETREALKSLLGKNIIN